MASPRSIRNLVNRGENVFTYLQNATRRNAMTRATGAYGINSYFTNESKRNETKKTTGAFRIPRVYTKPREVVKKLGQGSFGAVFLDKFPGIRNEPMVASKKVLSADDHLSSIMESSILRYFKGQANIVQFVGESPLKATGNTTPPTRFPLLMMSPAKSSLSDLITGPS